MSDLAAFLAARLNDDEAAAKDERIWFGPYPEDIGEFEGHLVIRDERVLREVAAKRAILNLYADWTAIGDGHAHDAALLEVLRRLGAVYGDHPDYDEAWKP